MLIEKSGFDRIFDVELFELDIWFQGSPHLKRRDYGQFRDLISRRSRWRQDSK